MISEKRQAIGKDSIKTMKEKRKLTCFFKNLNFQFLLKKMALKLFEYQEQFLIDTFLIKLTKLEKTGSFGKIFISLGI